MSRFLLESDIVEIAERVSGMGNLFEGKHFLLTGGRGFLGRYFTAVFEQLNKTVLKDNPIKVTCLDNMITAGQAGDEVEETPNVKFVKHNAIEPYETDEKYDYVVHAAGIASPHYYRKYPLETLDVAIKGTKNFLEVAKKNNARFTFFSSSEIYGDPDPKYVPTLESYRGNVSSMGPRACYDESKRVGETLCYIYHGQYGVHTNIIRPFNVYGPGMQERDYRVMPNFANKIKGNQAVNVYGTGNQTRTFCYITDAVVGFLKVFVSGLPGEPYNIGNPKPEVTMLQLVDTIETVLGRKIEKNIIEHPDTYPADEPMRRCPNITKARTQLEYDAQVDLADGVKRFLSWSDGVYSGEA